MHVILRVNTSPLRNILTFVQSCHKWTDTRVNVSSMPSMEFEQNIPQTSSASVQVCQLIPNYIRENMHVRYKLFVGRVPYCARQDCIVSTLVNFVQH